MKSLSVLRGKIKVYPEDFQVEEVIEIPVKSQGEYSYYKLKKKNINTLLVLDLIQKYWKVSRDRIGFCGLKDKRAVTTQYISIKNGPKKDLTGPNFTLTFIGKGDTPLKLGDAKGNIFTITLRGVNSSKLLKNLKLLKEIGFVNYFGEQRFAPDLYTKEPLVKYFLRRDYETALKEYFTQHPAKSRLLKKLWGRWKEFLKHAGHLSAVERRVLTNFIKKGDSEKALKVFPKHLKLLFLFSYQSLLWNRVACELVKLCAPKFFCVNFVKKEKLCFRELSPELKLLKDLKLPYISKEVLNWNGPNFVKEVILKVMKKEGLESQLDAEVLGLKVFNPGEREFIVFPEDLRVVNYSKNIFTIKFFLPSGSYATIFLLKLLSI